MNKALVIFLSLIFFIFVSKSVFSKGYKLFVCNYYVSYNLAKDNCSGANSFYKIYFDNRNDNFNSRDECMQEMKETINSSIMSQMFPEGDGTNAASWILDCDNLWKF